MICKKGARHKGFVLRSGTRVSAALQRVFEVAHFLGEKPPSRGGSGIQLFWNGYRIILLLVWRTAWTGRSTLQPTRRLIT